MIITVCVGSSCHLKGSERVVELFTSAIAENRLESEVALAGSFCSGRCNRDGVTVTVEDTVYTGITPENFTAFFEQRIIQALKNERM